MLGSIARLETRKRRKKSKKNSKGDKNLPFKGAGTLVSRYQLIVVIANSQQQGREASMAKHSTKSCLVDREVRCVTEGVKSELVIG